MFKCQECGATNKPGVIFCHSCGAKLDLDNLESVKEKRTIKPGKIVSALVKLLILAGFIAVLVGLFIPVDIETPQLEEEGQEKLKAALEHVLNDPQIGENEVYRLNDAAITALAMHLAGLNNAATSTDSGALAPQSIFITPMNSNMIKIAVRYSLFDKLSTDAVIIGKVSVQNKSPQLEIVKAWMGKIPMPGPLRKIAVGRVYAQFEQAAELSSLNGKTEALSVDDNVLMFKPVPRQTSRTSGSGSTSRSRTSKAPSGSSTNSGTNIDKGVDFGKGVDLGKGFDL